MTVPAAGVELAVATPEGLAQLAVAHWSGLVGLAAVLMGDRSHAEDVVQDVVVACLRRPPALRDEAAGLAYLRSAVLNRARSRLRRGALARRHDLVAVVAEPGADEAALAHHDQQRVVAAVAQLPRRQREAVVLRFWASASEKEAAAAMGVAVGSVKAYTSRGLAAVAYLLQEEETDA